MLKQAYKNLADYSAERQKWQRAVKYYGFAQDNESLAQAYFKLEDYASM